METEARTHKAKFEIRQNKDGQFIVEGLAAPYNSRSKMMTSWRGAFYEEIKPGAFREILKVDGLNVILNRNHNNNEMLARTASGTLELKETKRGLEYTATLPETTFGRDMAAMIQRGDYYENSFAFGLMENDYKWTLLEDNGEDEKIYLRTITNISLLRDVSIVTDGAYGATDIKLAERQLKEFEQRNLFDQEIALCESIFTNLKSI